MSKKSDPLNNEISVQAQMTPTGIDAKIKSRAAAAFDRIVGNFFDFFNIPIEERNARRRANMEANLALIEAAKKAVIKKAGSDAELQERLIEKQFGGIFRKQENKEEVARIAFEEMKRLPPPEADPSATNPETESIDDDWLNFFEDYAEKASSDRMRQLFGRILSGEIRKPGAFSFSTLRIAAELDQRTAELFQKHASVRFDNFIPRVVEPTHFSEFLELESAGLVGFGGGQLVKTLTANDERRIELVGETLLGRVVLTPGSPVISMPAVILTQAGRQIANILPNNELAGLKRIVDAIMPQIESATVHKINFSEGTTVNYELEPTEVLVQPIANPDSRR